MARLKGKAQMPSTPFPEKDRRRTECLEDDRIFTWPFVRRLLIQNLLSFFLGALLIYLIRHGR